MSWALISKPASLSDWTVAAFVERTMRAPKRESAASTLRSLCGAQRHALDGDGVVPMAPAHSQKAALDQSPSTATLPGVRYEPLLTRKFVTSGWPSLAGIRSTLTSTPKASWPGSSG